MIKKLLLIMLLFGFFAESVFSQDLGLSQNITIEIKEGQTVPELILSNLKGEEIGLKNFKGKPVLLWITKSFSYDAFFDAFEGVFGNNMFPSRLDVLEKINKAHKKKGLTCIIIIAGPNGEDEGKIRDLIQQKDYTFEVLVNKKADVGFADTSLFTIFLIDKKGIVRAGYPIQSFVVNVNIVKEIEPIISDKTKNPPTILTKYLKNLAKDYKNSFAKNFHYPSLEEYTECWEQEMELHKAELEKVYSPKQLETIKKIIPLTYISKKEREMLIPQEACKWALRKAIDLAEDETIPLQVKKRCGFIESANNIKNNPSLKKTFNYDDVDLSLFNGNNYIMECLRKDIPVELACWNSQIAQEVLHRYNIDPDGSYTQQEKAEIEKILIKENVPKETAPAYYICEDWVNDCYIYAYLRVKEKNLRKIAGLLGIKFEAFVKDLTATQYEAILNLDILASPEFTSLEKDITPPPGSRIYFLSQSLLKPSHIQLGLGRFGFITNGYFNPDSSRATAPFPYTSYHGWTIPCFLVNSFIFNVSKEIPQYKFKDKSPVSIYFPMYRAIITHAGSGHIEILSFW